MFLSIAINVAIDVSILRLNLANESEFALIDMISGSG